MKRMFKSTMAVFLAVVIAFGAVPIAGFVGIDLPSLLDLKAEAATYNASEAAKYALTYWENYNPNYSNYNSIGGDCANFVSQCLYAGGLPMDDDWYWYSYSNKSASWTGALSIKKYLVDNLGYKLIMYPSASQIEVGDVLWYGEGSHVGICSEVIDGVPWVCAHNYDRHTSNWKLGFSSYGVIKMNGVTGHTHSYVENYEAAHPHKVYKKCSCGDYYYTGATKKVDGCESCYPPSKSVWYNIAYDCTTEGGKFYDSDRMTVTITPKVDDRDAYDSEIKSIVLKVKCPDGSVITKNYGTTKSDTFYFGGDLQAGEYFLYAYVDTIYGSSEGSVGDGSLSITLSDPSLRSCHYETDEVQYLRICFSDLETYLTATDDGKVVSSKRIDDDSQIWKFIENSDGSYTIVSLKNNKALDVSDGSYVKGNDVLTYTQHGGENQKWELCKKGDDGYYLKPFKSNSAVVDVENSSTQNNARVGLWTFNGSAAQKVTFKRPYMIEYSANRGENPPSTQYKDYNKNITISSVKPTREGFVFVGWNQNFLSSTVKYRAGDTYTLNEDAKLYAVWKKIEYTIKYDANGGTGAPSSQTKYHGTDITITTEEPKGKIFTVTYNSNGGNEGIVTKTCEEQFHCWKTKDGECFYGGDTYSLEGNATLYADYVGYLIGSGNTATRDGYYFIGWYDSPNVDEDGNPTGKRYNAGEAITKDLYLYAMWSKSFTLLYGDYNLDGIVDFRDISGVNKYRLNKVDARDSGVDFRCDMDVDGDVDLDDMTIMNQLRNGEITQSDVPAYKMKKTMTVSDKTQREYEYNESFNYDSLEITITYSNGISHAINDYIIVSNYNPYSQGKQSVKISYYQYSKNIDVAVGLSNGIGGTITTSSPDGNVNFELIKKNDVNISYGSSASAGDTEYNISGIETGRYTVVVSQKNHATRTYDVYVGSEQTNLDFELKLLGDITGDGKVNTVDVARANSHAKSVSALDGYDFSCADVTGDGKVNTVDVARMNSHAKGVTKLW